MLGNILPSQPRRVEEIKSSKIAWFPDPDLLITENSSLVAADIPEILRPQDDDAELRVRSPWPLSVPEQPKRRVRPVREI